MSRSRPENISFQPSYCLHFSDPRYGDYHGHHHHHCVIIGVILIIICHHCHNTIDTITNTLSSFSLLSSAHNRFYRHHIWILTFWESRISVLCTFNIQFRGKPQWPSEARLKNEAGEHFFHHRGTTSPRTERAKRCPLRPGIVSGSWRNRFRAVVSVSGPERKSCRGTFEKQIIVKI